MKFCVHCAIAAPTHCHRIAHTQVIKGRYHGLEQQHDPFSIPFQMPTPARHANVSPDAVPPPPHTLELFCGSLSLNVNRSTLAKLMDLLQASLAPDTAPVTPRSAGAVLSRAPSIMAAPGSEAAAAAAAHAVDNIRRKYKLVLRVGTLQITLVRQQAAMARVALRHMTARVDTMETLRQIQGNFGSVLVTDLTPAGAHYREVFSTAGADILQFDIKDFLNVRGLDTPAMVVSVKMASVRCTYTRRFFAELSTYITQFQEMRNVIARMRAAAEGIMGSMESTVHVQLDIEIGRPVVIIPRNSFCDEALEADLGRMRITNRLMVRG